MTRSIISSSKTDEYSSFLQQFWVIICSNVDVEEVSLCALDQVTVLWCELGGAASFVQSVDNRSPVLMVPGHAVKRAVIVHAVFQ